MWLEKLGLRGVRSKAGSSTDGYIYVPAEGDGPLAHAEPGLTIRIPGRGPPWIVVDHNLSKVIVARWPGRLWVAQVFEAATEKDQAPSGGKPRASAKYTRAIAVRIGAELPVWNLFGAYGERVLPVIDVATALTREQASILATARAPEASQANNRTWRNWLTKHEASELHPRNNLDGTLAVSGVEAGSPVNSALSVIHNEVFKRAKFIEGDAATQDDGEDVWLVEPWSTASTVLIDAALALGAPDFVDYADAETLMIGWRALPPR